jgi:phage host-nuclease inhibitor protein Gam
VTAEKVFRELETLGSELSEIDTKERKLEAEKDEAIKAILDKIGPQIDPLVARRTEIVERLSEMVVEHEDILTANNTKTVDLRSVTLSVRSSPGVLVVEKPDGESRAIRALRRLRKLKMFTRVGKRTLNKDALKKNPEVVAKVPGVYIEHPE